MRLGSIWLPVSLQVVIPQLIHSKTCLRVAKSNQIFNTDVKRNTSYSSVALTGFAGGEGPNCLGADLPDRPCPLQLLRVGTRRCLARCGHRLTTEKRKIKKWSTMFSQTPGLASEHSNEKRFNLMINSWLKSATNAMFLFTNTYI